MILSTFLENLQSGGRGRPSHQERPNDRLDLRTILGIDHRGCSWMWPISVRKLEDKQLRFRLDNWIWAAVETKLRSRSLTPSKRLMIVSPLLSAIFVNLLNEYFTFGSISWFVRFAKRWRNLIIIPSFQYSERALESYCHCASFSVYAIHLKRKQQ